MRLGSTVTFTIPRLYIGQQSVGLIYSAPIPVEFRPTGPRYFNAEIIDGSRASILSTFFAYADVPNATKAVYPGVGQVTADGRIYFGLSCNNDQTFLDFGGAGTTGSGNGVLGSSFTYQL